MKELLEGVDRFTDDILPGKSERFRDLASGQSPKTLLIGCSDSRVVPELITQSEPGDLFVIRNAGNIVPPWQRVNGGVTSTIEFAVVGLGVTDIVICGHTDCGAMKAFSASPEVLETMPSVREWIGHSAAAHAAVEACCGDTDSDEKLEMLVEENVIVQLGHLKSHPCVAAALARGKLRLHGWVFAIGSGRIRALDGATNTFVTLGEDGSYAVADLGGRRMRNAA